jgi:hypothetical protein
VQLGFDQRAAHAGALGGFEPGTVVTEIVDVRAVDDVRHRQLLHAPRRDRVQLALAVEAAVGGIAGVARVVDLVRLDEFMARADRLGDADRVLALALR